MLPCIASSTGHNRLRRLLWTGCFIRAADAALQSNVAYANRTFSHVLHCMIIMFMAERVGFEPTIPLQVCRISSAVHSTTLPPLRGLVGACSARAFS